MAIVEDQGVAALELSRACKEVGYEPIIIELSGGPKELVAEITRHDPDVILLDHDLGLGFTGEDIYSELSEELQKRTIGSSSTRQKYVPLHVLKPVLMGYGLIDLFGGSK